MNDLKSAAKLALEALKSISEMVDYEGNGFKLEYEIKALEEALAKQEQGELDKEEVLGFNGWGFPIEPPPNPKQERDDWGWGPHESHSQPKQEDYLSKAYRLANELRCHLAISPAPQQQRTWVGLTDDEVGNLSDFAYANDEEFVRNVEKHLKEKNT